MRTKNRLGTALLMLILGFVPLIVSACHYRIGLKEYPWFLNADTSYDFFLYWKGQALILLCACLALNTAAGQLFGRKAGQMGARGGPELPVGLERRYMVPLAAYFLLSVLSAVLSGNRDMALWGGYEQWEGMFIVAAYVITLWFASMDVVGKTEITMIEWGLLAGVFVLSLLGTMQFFGHDFFRTNVGQAVMNLMTKKKLRFSFNFEVGRVYATLYNPNYVGSYVALMLPVVLSYISFEKRIHVVLRNVVALACSGFLVVMLFGSESVTGCIGAMATLLVFAVFFVVRNRQRPRRIALCAVLCVAVAGVAVWANRPIFEYGWNKLVNPTPNCFFVTEMESQDGCLLIRTVRDDILKLSVKAEDGAYQYAAEDGGNKSVPMYRNEDSEKMMFSDSRFSPIQISEKTVQADGAELDAFVVETPSFGKSYTIVAPPRGEGPGSRQTGYRIYNAFQKVDELRHIERVGFEDNQHFGSRRGFIWSRTIPLLKRHILLGSGPNTFVFEFPNDDYVGMTNVGYEHSTVTKPHNMFFQIWVQTGLLSLLAFLALYACYFIEGVRLYFSRRTLSGTDRAGLGILLGTFGYMVTGLANDSTVAVAPLFWCLLGVGMAVNRYNKHRSNE